MKYKQMLHFYTFLEHDRITKICIVFKFSELLFLFAFRYLKASNIFMSIQMFQKFKILTSMVTKTCELQLKISVRPIK